MKIVFIFADSPGEWGCSEWRCAIPARAINRTRRHHAKLVNIADFGSHAPAAIGACQPADVIVVQRNLVGAVLSAIQHWKGQGKVVLADFDEAYNLIPPTHPAHTYWIQGFVNGSDDRVTTAKIDPPPLTQFKWGLKMVDAATVPSKRLASDWQAYTNMLYLPNYIELSSYQDTLPEPHQDIVIGWGGSLSNLQSFTDSQVIQALQRVCHARPQVKVMISGSNRQFFAGLPLPPEHKILHPCVPSSERPNLLSNFEIGIAPLHGPYDERRSWIGLLEYMVMKIPWVASDGPAYNDLRSYGCLVYNISR